MLFGRLLQGGSNELVDNKLMEVQRQLRIGIEKAKNLATICKVSHDIDDITYITNSNGELVYPDFKADKNYNEQFWKTYLKNQISFAMIKQLSEKTTSLQQVVDEVESLQQEYYKLYKMKNRKKNRRLAVEIDKNYNCPYEKCYKIYGSDVSLNLHIKLKHNGGNKTDRQKLAEQICIAETRPQLGLPNLRLNLPPGYLQQYREKFQLKNDKTNDELT